MSKILLVEDDLDIRDTVLYALQSSGFEALGFESASPFFRVLETDPLPTLIILDIMLPGDDGLVILKKLRQNPNYKTLPIIMLTAKSSEIDKVKGLDLGADDYLTKPFSVMELIARIKALLRRSNVFKEANEVEEYQNIQLKHASRKVLIDGAAVNLTFKEYELLYYLMINKNMVLKREKILETIWGYDFEGESRTLDMHIKSLRKKLGVAGEHIKTIRNVGYKLGE